MSKVCLVAGSGSGIGGGIVKAAALAFSAAIGLMAQTTTAGELLQFPENYTAGVHYATVKRGNITEELYTSREAIDAAKGNRPFPNGTVITLADYRDAQLYRYVVMERRTGWGAEYPPDKRTGEWEFQWFDTDKSVRADEDLGRCMSCHKSQARQDFVWSVDQMKGAQ